MSGNQAVVVLNCRVCTQACKYYKSLKCEIETGPESSTTVSKMFTFRFGLSYEPQDGAAARLPQQICMACLPLAKQAYIFKRTAIEANKLLRLGLNKNANSHNNKNSNSAAAASANQQYVVNELLGGNGANEAEAETEEVEEGSDGHIGRRANR